MEDEDIGIINQCVGNYQPVTDELRRAVSPTAKVYLQLLQTLFIDPHDDLVKYRKPHLDNLETQNTRHLL